MTETLDFFHGWWQAHGALLDQVYQETPNYLLGWQQGLEHLQQDPGSTSSIPPRQSPVHPHAIRRLRRWPSA